MKIILVVTGVFSLVLLAMLFLSGIQHQRNSYSAHPHTEDSKPVEDEYPPRLAEGENDRGELLAELALEEQKRELAAIQARKVRPKPEIKETPPVTPKKQEVVKPVSPPTTGKPIAKPVELPPEKAWLVAAKLGSYGQVSLEETSRGNYQVYSGYHEANSREIVRVNNQPSNQINGQDRAENEFFSTVNYAEEAPVLLREPRSRMKIIVGSRARGIFNRAISWDNSPTALEQRFVITLLSPLKTAGGSAAIPANSLMVVKLRSLSTTGLVQFEGDSVIVETAGSSREIKLPSHVVSIHSSDGNPLIAQRIDINIDNSGGGVDAGGLAVDVFSTAAEMAEWRGASRLPRIYDRFAGSPYQYNNRNNPQNIAWFLPEETQVEVFINRSFWLDKEQ